MKNKHYLDDFEAFLSDSVEGHRMYPNDRVWRNITREIHGDTRWPALTFCAILTGAIILAGLIFIQPDKELFTIDTQALKAALASHQPKVTAAKHEFADAVSIGTKQYGQPKHMTGPVVAQAEVSPEKSGGMHHSGEILSYTLLEVTGSETHLSDFAEAPESVSPRNLPVLNATLSVLSLVQPQSDEQAREGTLTPAILSVEPPLAAGTPLLNVDHRQDLNAAAATAAVNAGADASPVGQNETPIYNSGNITWFTGAKKVSRWNLQYYVAPSVSNRILLEDKSFDLHANQNGPVAPNITYDVNHFVRHNPKLGLEAGAALLYSATDYLRFKVGLQLNFRQYGVEGFYNNTPEAATLRLETDDYGVRMVQSYSRMSSMLGSRPAEVNNQYLQVGIPVGFDLRMANWKKVQFYVAASLQPTYQLAERSLLISADYKHYVSEPDLLRKFNVNSTVEAFFSFRGGGLNWQVGPQIRYQMLPGAQKAYPIREHLIDYGMKIGVVKQLH